MTGLGYLQQPFDAERDAESVLEKYWNIAGTPQIPVDPIFIARQMGIEILETRLEKGVSGMLVQEPYAPARIYLSRDDGRVRQRFTCAHELGHWSKRSSLPQDSWAFVDRRDELSGRGTNPSEVYANAFAAAVLMPASEVRALSGHMRADNLARHFDVSGDAMNFRLANLGLRAR